MHKIRRLKAQVLPQHDVTLALGDLAHGALLRDRKADTPGLLDTETHHRAVAHAELADVQLLKALLHTQEPDRRIEPSISY